MNSPRKRVFCAPEFKLDAPTPCEPASAGFFVSKACLVRAFFVSGGNVVTELLMALGGTSAGVWLVFFATRLRLRRRYVKGKPQWDIELAFDPSRSLRGLFRSNDE